MTGYFGTAFFKTTRRFALAAIGMALLSFAPGTSSLVAAPAQAQNNKCGNLNQRACNVTDTKWYSQGACKKGLAATKLLNGRCAKNKSSVLKDARNTVRKHSAVIADVTKAWSACFTPASLLKAGGSRDQFYNAVSKRPCLAEVLQIAKDAGFGHVSIGSSASLGALIIGTDVETGFAFDVDGKRPPVFYQTRGVTFLTAGLSGSVVISLGKGPATVANLQGDEQSGSISFAAFVGSGATASFSYSGPLQSVGVVLTVGGVAEIGYSRTNTVARTTGRSAPRVAAVDGPRDPGGYGEPEPVVEYAPSERPTKLRFCNDTPFEHIYAGFSFWDDGSAMGRSGWSAKGWKKIKQGQCKTTTIPNDSYGYAYSGDVYVFASADGAWWGQEAPAMCVSTPESNIPLRMDNVDRGCPSQSDVYFDTGTYVFPDLPPSANHTFTFSGEPDYRPAIQVASQVASERTAPNVITPLFYSGKICNETSADVIYVGFGIEDPGRTYAHGWFPVRKGECHVESLGKGKHDAQGSYIWAYATDGTNYWGGNDKRFCLRTPETARRTSDTQTALCGGTDQFRMYTQIMGNLEEQRHLEHVFKGEPTGRIATAGSGN